ncbi:MAG: hypothetical protein RBR09_05130 [Desulfobulbaceae bacterium]|jgi:hypothetical protein|nr:hypothetical protein [Desulfobulbaceae bacterium]MDY0350619.1 hypothetical protein [Desulfobulbaceae bacterium]
MPADRTGAADNIVFGLTRADDERSLAAFLRLFSGDELLTALIPRMTDDEIRRVVQLLTEVMRNHLSGQEYHSLFLGGRDHSH